jgi:hypothetical protein
MWIWLHRPAGRRLAKIVVWAVLGCAAPVPARAEITISGGPAAIRLEASEASLEEILLALHASFNFRYRTSAVLDDAISGTYSGPLAHVAAQLLDRYDFIMRVSAEKLEISVLRRHAPDEAPGPTGVSSRPPRVLPVPPAMSALEASRTERR